MPNPRDIGSVLVIGSGPITIGQACEFDYSGTQACRVLKEEGIRVILLNSNPATIMTDPEFSDATYIEPMTIEVLEAILDKERPDAVLPTLGGQTALNLAMQLHNKGLLEKYGTQLIGATPEVIARGENREMFRHIVLSSGAEVATSEVITSVGGAVLFAQKNGYPLVIRPSYTMGGLGSSLVHTESELVDSVKQGIEASPNGQVLLEESIVGWKEYELELMRDVAGNTVIVCSIENIDPVGVHTGDSVTVAPAMTLTDREYQNLRNIAIAIIRMIGINTGGCNIQFAVNPTDGRVVVIEVNPRVSRSSALASKATGFPIAKLAAKLALGYRLHEIKNDITKKTFASFEPSLDYVAVKIPLFAFEKFPKANPELTTSMKSVGEVMAIGRNFTTALQKAMRSLDQPHMCFHWQPFESPGHSIASDVPDPREYYLDFIRTPLPSRLVAIQQALRFGASIDEVHEASRIDKWFVSQIDLINKTADSLKDLSMDCLSRAKRHGFSDRQIADLLRIDEEDVRKRRSALGIAPVYKTVDTCAGEFPAVTPYYYSSYDSENEAIPSPSRKVIIIGSGPNRIGQGIEFDYSCVHAAMALSGMGIETVMINCNPETVSTDYDTSDRLYFEPLTLEDVLEVISVEQRNGDLLGVIAQLGGQIPLSLAKSIQHEGIPILGTSPESIDLAENRDLFSNLLRSLNLPTYEHRTVSNKDEAIIAANKMGFPVLLRPSFVLGGRGMKVIHDSQALEDYFNTFHAVDSEHPLLIDKFLSDAIEVDVDALYDKHELFIGGIMEHIEEAGIHSGDSSCTIPPVTLGKNIVNQIVSTTHAIARTLSVLGPVNIQFAIASGILYVLEANPRSSRTLPFVSKATGIPLAKAATRIMLGHTIEDLQREGLLPQRDMRFFNPTDPIAVKEVILPFKRFRTKSGEFLDTLLGPEMQSTGEVMGIGPTFPIAFAKSQQAAFSELPRTGAIFVSVADHDKRKVVLPAMRFYKLGFKIFATSGTADTLRRFGIDVVTIQKFSEAKKTSSRSVVDLIREGRISLVINTPSGGVSIADGYEIRVTALACEIPVFTTISEMNAAVISLESGSHEIASLQELYSSRARSAENLCG
ncbi:carbamoyl-phosphate synthase large subunit [Tropheryma whipplei]|uniref:carbamoyl-phosphate synthase large subunit n=1 Tax=Tropheryma whipplei TaxID=2039 RepID=UPI0004B3E271|nr:carbamoyl-phosphate synthase large subunit [Tropheryma whipplei]